MGVNWTNFTDFGQLPAAANEASNGSFWVGMLYMMWIILMLMLMPFGFEVAIITASFVFLIISLLLTYAGLIAWTWVLTFVGVLLFMFLYVIWSTNKGRT